MIDHGAATVTTAGRWNGKSGSKAVVTATDAKKDRLRVRVTDAKGKVVLDVAAPVSVGAIVVPGR